MSANNTTLTLADFLPQIISGGPAIPVCLTNGLLLLTILLDKSLRKRKEMLIITGLAAADFVYGLGGVLLAIYRSTLMFLGLQTQLTHAWVCSILPPVFFGYLGVVLVAVMNLVVSIDRYMAVAWPTKYRNLDQGYALKVLGGVGIFAAIFVAGMFLSSYFFIVGPLSLLPSTCTYAFLPMWFVIGEYTIVSVSGCLCVAIYIRMFFVYRAAIRHAAPISVADVKSKMERRLTVTLGLIVVCTTSLFVLPTIFVVAISMKPGTVSTAVIIPIGIVTRLSTVFNVAIYIFRQKEIRTGMWYLLRCKKVESTKVVSMVKRNTAVHRLSVTGSRNE